MTPNASTAANPASNRATPRTTPYLARPEVHAWAMERPFVTAAGLSAGMTVVDLGCGDGSRTLFFRAQVGPTGAVIGIDVDADLIDTARARELDSGADPVRYEVASAYDTGLDDASVDVVVARHLFQHLTDPARALAEVARILKPGGRVVLLDTHDGLLCLHPEPAGHADFMRRAAEHQRLRGGDREAGRKLAGRLAEAGFHDVCTDVHVFDTGRLPTDLFVGLALTPLLAVFEGDASSDAEAHLEACRDALASGDAHGSAGFYATWAVKG